MPAHLWNRTANRTRRYELSSSLLMLRQPATATADYRPPSLSLDPDAIYFTFASFEVYHTSSRAAAALEMLESEASGCLLHLLNRPVIPVQTRARRHIIWNHLIP
jgi:hypothetical protein